MSLDYCADLVRRVDYPLYVALLVLPRGLRPVLLPLFAFDAELTHVPLAAREPMLRNIRYQWWREAVARLFSGESDHQPVVNGLRPHVGLWGETEFEFHIATHEDGGDTRQSLRDMTLRAAPLQYHMSIIRLFDALGQEKGGPLLPLRLWWRTIK